MTHIVYTIVNNLKTLALDTGTNEVSVFAGGAKTVATLPIKAKWDALAYTDGVYLINSSTSKITLSSKEGFVWTAVEDGDTLINGLRIMRIKNQGRSSV